MKKYRNVDINLFNDILLSSFLYLFIYTFIIVFIYLFIHLFKHLFIYSCIYLCIYSCIYSCIYLFSVFVLIKPAQFSLRRLLAVPTRAPPRQGICFPSNNISCHAQQNNTNQDTRRRRSGLVLLFTSHFPSAVFDESCLEAFSRVTFQNAHRNNVATSA